MKHQFNRVASAFRALPAAVTVAALAALASVPAQAQPVDVTSLTAAVDFSTVTVAIMAVAAILITVYIAIKAAKFVMGMVKSG